MEKEKILDKLNTLSKKTMVENLGIKFNDIRPDLVRGKMPVDHRTNQPYGLLHGGASSAFAETLGSVAGGLHINRENTWIVGVEINCNHLKSVTKGFVHGKATPVKIGKKFHVWNIEIKNDAGDLIDVSRLTLAVIHKK